MTGSSLRRRPRPGRPGGFTLVELLVTVTIIAILASISLLALASARETTRIDATRATIEKLNAIILERYESYRTRRVPLTQEQIDSTAAALATQYASVPVAKRPARIRLDALRDLMRMEMPDRWSDVFRMDPSQWPNFATMSLGSTTWRPNLILPPALPAIPAPPDLTPALTIGYFRNCQAAWAAMKAKMPTPSDTDVMAKLQSNAAAECLYMIVMSDPDAAAQFHASEIADTDGDGLPEFVDGWGKPIRFIRWPAGFIRANQADGDLADGDPAKHHDPFDTKKIQAEAFATYPLVYSAGPDGEYDINIGKNGSDNYMYGLPLDPYANDGNGYAVGRPLDDKVAPSGDPTTNLNHFDNVHNQRVEGR